MPINFVIGYTDRSFNPETAKILYLGGDGVKCKAVLAKENDKYPVREAFRRPLANLGRRIDSAARAEDTYVPDLGLDVPADEPAAPVIPVDEAPTDVPETSDTPSEK